MKTVPSLLMLVVLGCAPKARPVEAPVVDTEAGSNAPQDAIPVVSVCIPTSEGAPLAPTFFVHLDEEAHVQLGDEGQRHEVRAVVHRDGLGYRVHIRHLTDDEVVVDAESVVQPGIPARIDASNAIVQLDLETQEALRTKQRGGIDLTTETGCRSI